VAAATERDMGVFIISPNDKGGKLYQPPPKLLELCAPLAPMYFHTLWCLGRPEVHTLSIGASRPSDFDVHVAALADLDRAAELTAPIVARLYAELERVLGADWCANWWRGLPDHEHMPGQLNVHEILRLWTWAKGLDMVEFARMRYNLLGNAGHWFPGRNAGSFDEAAVLAAVRENPFADRIPAILREAHELLFTAPAKRLSEG
jgi:predicted aldo/keto reductase-like oxidoreductase